MLVTGAPDAVLPLCRADHLGPDVEDMAGRGLRVLAVATGPLPDGSAVDAPADELERDLRLLGRAFGVIGPAEAAVQLGAFLTVLVLGGWRFGDVPQASLLAAASGTAFSTIVLGQLANAFACRSEHRAVGSWSLRGNRLLLWAVASELVLLAVFLAVPPVAGVLGHAVPTTLGWALAALAVPTVLLADAAQKAVLRRTGRRTEGLADRP